MKTLLATLALFLTTALPSFAVTPVINDHTAREEAEGKVVFEQLQNKKITCDELTEENFGALGEYFMGQMMGSNHEQMNTMMTNMMGAEGEKQMHVAMGRRMSTCDPQAPLPPQMSAMMNMMSGGMMGSGMLAPYQAAGFGAGMGGYPSSRQNNVGYKNYTNMMGSFGFPFMASWGWFGPLFMLAFWALVIWGIVALVRGNGKGGHGCCGGHDDEHDKEHKK